MPDTNRNFSPIHYADLPYLDRSVIGKRVPVAMPFHDGATWHLWVPTSNAMLQPMAVLDLRDGFYLAKKPERDDDILVEFIDWMIRRVAIAGTDAFRDAMFDDILNICTSLTKLDAIHSVPWLLGDAAPRAAWTEVEFILASCRSLFDLLQEVAVRVWESIKLFDGSKKKRRLPGSFSDMVLKSGRLRTAEDLENTFGIPRRLAGFYESSSAFFQSLRTARDTVFHRVHRSPIVFRAEHGFAVDVTAAPFSSIVEWDSRHTMPNNLGSLRCWLAHVIWETISVCERFAEIMSTSFVFPPDFAPGYSIFIRGPSVAVLYRLPKVANENPWAKFSDTPGTRERMSVVAFEFWEREGRPSGRDLDHWLAAERILTSRTEH